MSPGKPARRRLAFVLVLLAALAPALAAEPPSNGMHRAQKHENRREIDQLELDWRDAVIKSDTAAMANLLSDDDYLGILPNGTLQTKEETLANMRAGATHFTSIVFSDRRVRFHGTTALVTSRADVTGTTAAGAISGSYRYTRVYVRDKQGAWKIVSFEATRISETGVRRK